MIASLIIAIIAVLALELLLRFLKVMDVPLYEVDDDIGYVLKASQQGSFLRSNAWRTGKLSTLNSSLEDGEQGILVLGDSIVVGDIKTPNSASLIGQLQKHLETTEYSIAAAGAGSWGILNEIAYLNRIFQEPRSIKLLVWVINAGDAYYRSKWSSDFQHPRRRPLIISWFLFRRNISRWLLKFANKSKSPFIGQRIGRVSEEVRKALPKQISVTRKAGVDVLIVLYPYKFEVDQSERWREDVSEFRNFISSMPDVNLLDLMDINSWDSNCYKDRIHPNQYGNTILANQIQSKLK